jgi:Family of unknown function (DUF6221)
VTIEEFIEQRVAEDENDAHGAMRHWDSPHPETWAQEQRRHEPPIVIDPTIRHNPQLTGDGVIAIPTAYGHARHIARNDPARALRRCAALREIVSCAALFTGAPHAARARILDAILRPLAAIWSDHPDYTKVNPETWTQS